MFDLGNDNFFDLMAVDEQPKLTDPRVADIPVKDVDEEDLGDIKEAAKKPLYATRAVEARQD